MAESKNEGNLAEGESLVRLDGPYKLLSLPLRKRAREFEVRREVAQTSSDAIVGRFEMPFTTSLSDVAHSEEIITQAARLTGQVLADVDQNFLRNAYARDWAISWACPEKGGINDRPKGERPEMGPGPTAPIEHAAAPVPMLLWCPGCGERHIDAGEFATRSHATHACQFCGMTWRPALVDTVGVQFLPGFKNEERVESINPRDTLNRIQKR